MVERMLSFYKRIRVYLTNTSWIMTEKIAIMGLGFLVTIVLARYLGPEKFGILTYAISVTTLFSVAGHVGLSGLVVRELVKEPENKRTIMGTSFVLKGLGYFIGFILVLLIAFITEVPGSVEFWMLIIISFSLFFKPFDVIDFWFQAQLNAKYTAISRTLATLASSGIKLLLVFLGAQLVLFAVAHLVQTVFSAILLIIFFSVKSELNIKDMQFSKEKAKELFKQCWIIFLGSIFAVIYLKVDQVMLKWMVGSGEVGVYAVASSLSEAWYFVPTAIVASFFPKLIKLKDENSELYHYRLQQLFDFLFVIALCVAFLVTYTAGPIILNLFGESYAGSVSILVVHIWAALFIFMRAVLSKWILIENVLIFSLITQGLGSLANVALNWWLIPLYGGLGAAYATLISYAIAAYCSLVFHRKTRVVFVMMTKAFVIPIRYMFFKRKLK